MKTWRLLAVLLFVSGPAWFALASAAQAPTTAPAKNGTTVKDQRTSLAQTAPRPQPVPPLDPAEFDAAVRKGVDFLVGCQNKDGSWGSPAFKGGVALYTPVPGAFRRTNVPLPPCASPP